MSQEVGRGSASLGLLLASLSSLFLLAESLDATLSSVCLWKLQTKREEQGSACEVDMIAKGIGGVKYTVSNKQLAFFKQVLKSCTACVVLLTPHPWHYLPPLVLLSYSFFLYFHNC